MASRPDKSPAMAEYGNFDPGAMPMPGRPAPKLKAGRFQVLPRRDGKWIIYDPARPFAHRTVFVGARDGAIAALGRKSAEATRRGEPNDPERKGFEEDWGDPATWERHAVRYFRRSE